MLTISSCKSNINDLRSEKHESPRKSNISETVITNMLPSLEQQEDVKFVAS